MFSLIQNPSQFKVSIMQDPQTKTHTIDITAARARVNELLNITHSLSQLINQENDFIKARNI